MIDSTALASRRVPMGMVEWFEFQMPGKVICAEHCVDSIGTEMDKACGNRILIIADEGVEKAGLVRHVIDGMESGNGEVVGVFNEVPPNSELQVVQVCYEKALELEADALISVGGGSSIDTAKATAILMVEGGNLIDHQSAVYMPRGPLPPHIAVPTTSGTGSESTYIAMILDKDQQLKLRFQTPELTPTVAMLDPVMTITMPPLLTASTGMDAMAHCIEAIYSQMHQPISDSLGLHAVRLIARYLPVATRNGDDIEARTYMAIAANMAGMAFANSSTTIVHAMANSVGGHFGVPHGVANAILLPYGMEFNIDFMQQEVAPQLRMVAEALGLDVSGDDDLQASGKAVEFVKRLTVELGLPRKLSEVRVPEDGLERVSRDAMLDSSIFNNPGEPELEQVVDLFRKAY
jgi:alcohol dehydrogenase class IV